MEDLKRMTWLVYFCAAGVAVCLGGGIYTAWNVKKAAQELNKPENAVPVPAVVN